MVINLIAFEMHNRVRNRPLPFSMDLFQDRRLLCIFTVSSWTNYEPRYAVYGIGTLRAYWHSPTLNPL
ncbi:hypothetical protein KCU61_g561, partial [Aureobasidium melanogenum]